MKKTNKFVCATMTNEEQNKKKRKIEIQQNTTPICL